MHLEYLDCGLSGQEKTRCRGEAFLVEWNIMVPDNKALDWNSDMLLE